MAVIMALWQYSFFILPKASGEDFSAVEIEPGFNLFKDDYYWRKEETSFGKFSNIENVLPRGESWNNKLIVYGDIDSHCLEVYCEEDLVVSVTLRINYTIEYEFLLRELIHFFMWNELILLDGDLNIVQLNFESIKAVIDNSENMKKYKQLSGG